MSPERQAPRFGSNYTLEGIINENVMDGSIISTR